MPILQNLEPLTREVMSWRHDIHKHPELGYEEVRTSKLVIEILKDLGIEVRSGIGGTGVIGIMKKGNGGKSIGLRADLDALPLREESALPYKSVYDKKMHACGHDGHTAMLLGAAKRLAQNEEFSGTVFFIFQPAEEHLDGARKMINDGLFDIAPADAFYGMHNWPGLPVGKFAIRNGPALASFDKFDICITGVGGHGGLPHTGIDPIIIAAQVVNNIQSIVSRNVNPLDSAVVSVTHIQGGEPSYNVIPNSVYIKGAVRTLSSETRILIKGKIKSIVEGVCTSQGATGEIKYSEVCPVLVNAEDNVNIAVKAARSVVDSTAILQQIDPVMGSEDFAEILVNRPGAYIFIGNGDGQGACMIHNPKYDFNDAVIPFGITFWCKLVLNSLSK